MEREDGAKMPDPTFNKKDGSIDLRALLNHLSQKQMGIALDYARISGMSDRSFTQFQRSLKDSFYGISAMGLQLLENSGQITKIPDSRA